VRIVSGEAAHNPHNTRTSTLYCGATSWMPRAPFYIFTWIDVQGENLHTIQGKNQYYISRPLERSHLSCNLTILSIHYEPLLLRVL